LDTFLLIFERPVNFFYLISDVALLVIASTLLLAFWGGRFSQSWRMIAAAAFAKYVADLSLKVSSALPGDYESGGLLEACYVFSGLLYAVGAALEFDVSTSTRGRGRRRRGGA
jgi:urea transporter